MMKVIVCGACGSMGREVIRFVTSRPDLSLAAAVDATGGPDIYTDIGVCQGDADVLIDFSYHSSITAIMDYCLAKGLPAVIATTGHTVEEQAIIQKAADHIPIFQSANMSVGIHLLRRLVGQAAALLPNSDVEIVEIHHNRKQDAPSGTALLLADAVKAHRPAAKPVGGRWGKGKREPDEIGIHALRMGNIVGVHEVAFSFGSQTLTLRHDAHDRAIYAEGALQAAAFLIKQDKGLYHMDDLLRES